jgi:hypothetical protein
MNIPELYKKRKATLKRNDHVKWFINEKLTEEELNELLKLARKDYGNQITIHQAKKYIHVYGGGQNFCPKHNNNDYDPIDYNDPDWYNEWINDGWN